MKHIHVGQSRFKKCNSNKMRKNKLLRFQILFIYEINLLKFTIETFFKILFIYYTIILKFNIKAFCRILFIYEINLLKFNVEAFCKILFIYEIIILKFNMEAFYNVLIACGNSFKLNSSIAPLKPHSI